MSTKTMSLRVPLYVMLGLVTLSILAYEAPRREDYTASVQALPRGLRLELDSTWARMESMEWSDTAYANWWVSGDSIRSMWFCWDHEARTLLVGEADSVIGRWSDLTGPNISTCDTTIFAPSPWLDSIMGRATWGGPR
jgi:hypothetical protein